LLHLLHTRRGITTIITINLISKEEFLVSSVMMFANKIITSELLDAIDVMLVGFTTVKFMAIRE
jgi:hypothetical protein